MTGLRCGSAVNEVVNDRSQAVGRDVERRKRDRQPETASARASGIQVEHAPDRVDLRHMGMPGNDDVDAGRDGIDPQGLEIVHDEDGSSASRTSPISAYSRAQSPVSTFDLSAVPSRPSQWRA
jgi:hypothetical protein